MTGAHECIRDWLADEAYKISLTDLRTLDA